MLLLLELLDLYNVKSDFLLKTQSGKTKFAPLNPNHL